MQLRLSCRAHGISSTHGPHPCAEKRTLLPSPAEERASRLAAEGEAQAARSALDAAAQQLAELRGAVSQREEELRGLGEQLGAAHEVQRQWEQRGQQLEMVRCPSRDQPFPMALL